MSINSTIISGNLTRDVETRTTASGACIAEFSVAVNERVQKNGEWTDRVSFIDVETFGNRAETVAKYLHKGSRVIVAGRLRQERWQDRNGNNRSTIRVIADDVELPPKAVQGDSKALSDDGTDEYLSDEQIPF